MPKSGNHVMWFAKTGPESKCGSDSSFWETPVSQDAEKGVARLFAATVHASQDFEHRVLKPHILGLKGL